MFLETFHSIHSIRIQKNVNVWLFRMSLYMVPLLTINSRTNILIKFV